MSWILRTMRNVYNLWFTQTVQEMQEGFSEMKREWENEILQHKEGSARRNNDNDLQSIVIGDVQDVSTLQSLALNSLRIREPTLDGARRTTLLRNPLKRLKATHKSIADAPKRKLAPKRTVYSKNLQQATIRSEGKRTKSKPAVPLAVRKSTRLAAKRNAAAAESLAQRRRAPLALESAAAGTNCSEGGKRHSEAEGADASCVHGGNAGERQRNAVGNVTVSTMVLRSQSLARKRAGLDEIDFGNASKKRKK